MMHKVKEIERMVKPWLLDSKQMPATTSETTMSPILALL